MFSGGRDRNIYLTDLRQSEAHLLVCRETDPVLKMVLTPEQSGKPLQGFDELLRIFPHNLKTLKIRSWAAFSKNRTNKGIVLLLSRTSNKNKKHSATNCTF